MKILDNLVLNKGSLSGIYKSITQLYTEITRIIQKFCKD